jgi:hypothetical protein
MLRRHCRAQPYIRCDAILPLIANQRRWVSLTYILRWSGSAGYKNARSRITFYSAVYSRFHALSLAIPCVIHVLLVTSAPIPFLCPDDFEYFRLRLISLWSRIERLLCFSPFDRPFYRQRFAALRVREWVDTDAAASLAPRVAIPLQEHLDS